MGFVQVYVASGRCEVLEPAHRHNGGGQDPRSLSLFISIKKTTERDSTGYAKPALHKGRVPSLRKADRVAQVFPITAPTPDPHR